MDIRSVRLCDNHCSLVAHLNQQKERCDTLAQISPKLDIQQASQRTGLNNDAVKCRYLEDEDILQIRLSYKTIVREASPDWHTNIGYAEDGSIVEIVLLDAKKEGLLPLEFRNAA